MKKVLQLILFLLCSITFSQSVATYDIVFESYWNALDHSTLPQSSHWSSLVGANHNSNVTFMELGGIENKITSPSKNHELIIDEELSFVKIYPNPVTNGKINLSISQNKSAIKFQIVNFQGQVLYQATLSNNTIDVAYLPSGSYILILQTANSKFVKRFIK
ncbi:MAG: T9SS type A sorting domain-containing protein [Tamlana sp.]